MSLLEQHAVNDRIRKVPFPREEFEDRLRRVRKAASGRFDVLIITEPANICYLTGYDAWSFYVPQALVVPISDERPFLVLRELDVAAAKWTTHLPDEDIHAYPEDLVSGAGHPMVHIASVMEERGVGAGRIGVELDSSCFTVRSYQALASSLPQAALVDSELTVDWVRAIKTTAEIATLRQAARISDLAMDTAHRVIAPGVREATAAAAVYDSLIVGVDGMSGTCPLRPCMMRGQQTETPHLSWSDDVYTSGEPVVIELGGHRHNYAAGLTRTLFLGDVPQAYRDLDAIVLEGREAALEAMRAGNTAEHVEAAWRSVVNPRGVYKSARIGYSIGLSFPSSTWVEPTISLAAGDRTVLAPNMSLHLMLEVWGARVGHGVSDAVVITDGAPEVLGASSPELRMK